MNAEASDDSNIADCFDEVFGLYQESESSNESVSSEWRQKEIAKAIERAKDGILVVNNLQLFSDNEELDELPTKSLKFLLFPAFIGYFSGLSSGDRTQALELSDASFRNFLKLCKNYNVSSFEIPKEDNEPDIPASAAVLRENKIKKFKEQKEREQNLIQLRKYVEQDHIDEEKCREYYVALLHIWIHKALDELASIKMERDILKYRAVSVKNGAPERPKTIPKSASANTYILTRTKLEAGVFGLGYPSVPTYSIEEFYDQQGIKVEQQAEPPAKSKDEEDAVKELKVERDDADLLKEMRDWDAFKDENRAGSGNTFNKG